ncbi:HisS [Caligus rogercresseyi]|uniref:HisS n=1 Tax=Caligus rogercresseyi TaxID=217165 RepID=A0A7T8H1Q4_CALRO|nr:HisS [Caligus rogercresseyi]
MAKPKKNTAPKGPSAKGFRDYFGAEVTQRAEMLMRLQRSIIATALTRLKAVLLKRLRHWASPADVDRPNEVCLPGKEDSDGDKPGDWLALRYDMTAHGPAFMPSTGTICQTLIVATRWAQLAQRKARTGSFPPVLSV